MRAQKLVSMFTVGLTSATSPKLHMLKLTMSDEFDLDKFDGNKLLLLAAAYFALGCFFISMVEPLFKTVLELSTTLLLFGAFLWALTIWLIPDFAFKAGYTLRKHYGVAWFVSLVIMLKMRFGVFG